MLEVLEATTAETDSSPLEKLEDALQQAQRCSPTFESIEAALKAGQQVYVTSAWGELTVGQRITAASDLPSCEPFGLRLVGMPTQSDPEKIQTALVYLLVEDSELRGNLDKHKH